MAAIKIQNPISGQGWMKRKRAKDYIRRGLAAWVIKDAVIRFIRSEASDYRDTAALNAALASLRSARSLDEVVSSGMASLDQISGLPCVAPQKLIREGSERFSPRSEKRGPVRILSCGAPA